MSKIIEAIMEKIEKTEKISFLFPLLFIIAQALGYIYNIEYLNFFSIDKEFYYFNVFDLVPLTINFIIFSILILIIIESSGYIKDCFEDVIFKIFKKETETKEIHNFKLKIYKFKSKNEIKTIIKENNVIKRFAYIGLLISIYSFALVFITQGNLKGWGNVFIALCYHSLLLGLSRVIFSPTYKKEKDNNEIFNITFLLIIAISFLTIVGSLSEIEAESKTNFNLIENNQIILYSTPDYAIIAQYTYDEKSNTANIYTNELTKIDLTNLKFKNHTFKEVNIIRE